MSKGVLSDGGEAAVSRVGVGYIGSAWGVPWMQWRFDGSPLNNEWPVLMSVDGVPLRPQAAAPVPAPAPSTGSSRRREVLERIASCVCRDRQNNYGDAEDNFQDIADYWTLWLRQRGLLPKGKEIDALDVAQMSSFIKIARKVGSLSYLDNWIDDGGYSVCGAGIVLSREANP